MTNPDSFDVLAIADLATIVGGAATAAPKLLPAPKPFSPKPGEVKNGIWFPGGGPAGIAVPTPAVPGAIPFGLPPM